MTSTGFMIAMGVILLALIGLLLFLRNQRPD
jgi:LPXTG-motif cell wall-anchored protein